MTKIFSVEIKIAATAYVIATDEADARKQLAAFHLDGGEIPTGEFIEGLPVSGLRYGDPDFPPISISPAVTIYADETSASFVEEAEHDWKALALAEGWTEVENDPTGALDTGPCLYHAGVDRVWPTGDYEGAYRDLMAE